MKYPTGLNVKEENVMKKVLLVLMIFAMALVIIACTPQQEHTHTATGEFVVIKEATCIEEGVAHMFCAECGEIVDAITIPKTNTHSEVVIPAVESTCKEAGLTEGKECSLCGKVVIAQQEAPLKAHTEEIISAVDATCTTTGLSEGKKCSTCGDILIAQQETPVVAHTYDDKYDETCNECGFIRDAECAHRETETIKGYYSTCTSTGLTDGSKCKKCGEILVSQTVISANGHTEVIDAAVEPTCTIIGLTEGKHCSVCNAVIVAQETINANGHSFEEWVIVTKPSVSKEGLKERVCFCGDKETETIAKLVPSQGLEFSLNTNGQSYSVKGIGTCIDTTILIPNTYHGLPVTSIGANAFFSYSTLTSVVIPNSVTSIGDYAFFNCSRLTSIEIGDSVTSIGHWAFNRCYLLTSIEVDENNEYYKSIDGNLYAKDGKTLIQYAIGKKDTLFNIPDFVTSIGESAFDRCSSLTSIEIPDSVTVIGDNAFEKCTSLATIVIPDSVTSIGNYIFVNCDSLTSIVISNSITSIYSGLFQGCSSLTSIEIDESNEYYKSIDGSLYTESGKTLTHYAIGKQDTSFDIPGSVTIVGDFAFITCASLTTIVIPNSVTTIGTMALAYCFSLTSINFEGTVEQWNAISKGNDWDWKIGNYTIYCTDGEIAKDGTVTYYEVVSKGLEFTLNDDGKSYSVTGIGTCTDTEINIPSTYNDLPVTNIENRAFWGCDNFNSVIIPNSITSVGDEVFYSCDSLTNITISSEVTSIGSSVFAFCYMLTNIEVDENNQFYQSIDGNLYTKDGRTLIQYAVGKQDTTFIIQNGVISIADSAFSGNKILNSITIPNSITNIGYKTFAACTSLTSIVIPDSVTSIGESVFHGCTSLTNITLSKKLTTIPAHAFGQCSSLQSISIPEGVTSIGDYAFDGCRSLSTIVIPNSVLSFGYYSFEYCPTNLSFKYNGTVQEWNNIKKYSGWNSGVYRYTVSCIDGKLSY